MPTEKNRVMFLCDDQTKKDLKEWAEAENRSISNLVETIIVSAIAERKSKREEKAK